MAKIQHKDLPDQYLHEPKGASSAAQGTLYIADGNGGGAFGFPTLSSLSFDRTIVGTVTITSIPTPISENGAGLTETATGSMSDIGYVTQVPVNTIKAINKNFKELYTIYAKDVEIHAAVKADVEALATKLNAVITALTNIGVFTENV